MPTVPVCIYMALKAQLQSVPGLPALALPGKVFEPVAGTSWVEVMNITPEPERIMISPNRKHNRLGTFQALIYTPLEDMAYEASQELGGRVANAFPVDFRMNFGGVTVRVVQEPAIGDGFRDRSWWVTPVRIRWQSLS